MTIPRCFRCHDGNMKNAKSGEVIPRDRDTCHGILIDGSPNEPDLRPSLTLLAPPTETSKEAQ